MVYCWPTSIKLSFIYIYFYIIKKHRENVTFPLLKVSHVFLFHDHQANDGLKNKDITLRVRVLLACIYNTYNLHVFLSGELNHTP